jgi:hypothetical protein
LHTLAYIRLFVKWVYFVEESHNSFFLIAPGKVDATGSVLMIEHMERPGKMQKTEQYTVYRIGKPATTHDEEGRGKVQ